MASIDFPVTSKDSASLDSKTANHILRTGWYNEGTDQPIDPVRSTPTFCCKLGEVVSQECNATHRRMLYQIHSRARDFLFRRQERHCDGYRSSKAQLKDNEQLICCGFLSREHWEPHNKPPQVYRMNAQSDRPEERHGSHSVRYNVPFLIKFLQSEATLWKIPSILRNTAGSHIERFSGFARLVSVCEAKLLTNTSKF